MKALLIYLAQVIIISGLLYGYYHFFLRNNRFHHYNRYYLLSATFLSLAIPFLNIPVYFSHTPEQSSFVIQALTGFSPLPGDEGVFIESAPALPSGRSFSWTALVQLLLLLTALFFAVRLIISIFRIRRIIRNNPVEKLDRIRFVNTNEPGTPYSFFRWLFWNREINPASDKGQQIFRHELFHIRQRHSIDIVFLELLFIPFFLNPFFYLIKKELRAIHEFLADKYASSNTDKWEYAELLLMQTLNTQQGLVNPFFHNQIKRRIAMITNSKKPSYQYLRKILVLPIAFLSFLLFAFSYRYATRKPAFPKLDHNITVVIDAGHGGKDIGALASDGTTEKDIVLEIAKKIMAANNDVNLRVLLTREFDESRSLQSRTEFSKSNNADLFLSIHVNSLPDKRSSCFEILTPTGSKKYVKESSAFGKQLMNRFINIFPTHSTGGQDIRDGVWILEKNDCAAALIECGNFANPDDLAFIKNPANQEKIANTILAAIVEFGNQRSVPLSETLDNPADTARKKLVLIQHGQGKYGGSFDGIQIKEHFTQSNGSMVLMLENRNMVVLTKEVSLTIYRRKGYDMTMLLKKDQFSTIDPSKIKIDADSKEFTKKMPELLPRFPGGEQKWREVLREKIIHSILPLKKERRKVHTQ